MKNKNINVNRNKYQYENVGIYCFVPHLRYTYDAFNLFPSHARHRVRIKQSPSGLLKDNFQGLPELRK